MARVQRELSGVIDELRPAGGELTPALRRLVTAWTARTGTVATVDVETDRAQPAEPLLPVASEALANVERHAGASRVILVIGDGELTVTDDGVGLRSDRPGPWAARDAGAAGRVRWHAGGVVRPVRNHPAREVPDVITVLLADDHALVAPATRVVVLTSYQSDSDVFPALRAGALSYLLKDAGPDELAAAIRSAAAGESVLHPQVAAADGSPTGWRQ